MKDQDYLKLTIQNAKSGLSNHDGGPFGAVIVKDGKIISESHNTVLTDTDPTAHAEINAIRKACKKLNTYHLDGCTLYTSSEPCPMCLGAIYWAHIKRVVFITDRKDVANVSHFDDKIIYDEIAKDFSERKILFEKNGKLMNEGRKLLSRWNLKNDEQY